MLATRFKIINPCTVSLLFPFTMRRINPLFHVSQKRPIISCPLISLSFYFPMCMTSPALTFILDCASGFICPCCWIRNTNPVLFYGPFAFTFGLENLLGLRPCLSLLSLNLYVCACGHLRGKGASTLYSGSLTLPN